MDKPSHRLLPVREATASPMPIVAHWKGLPLPRSTVEAVPGSTTLAPVGPTSGPSPNRLLSYCGPLTRSALSQMESGPTAGASVFEPGIRPPARPGPRSPQVQPVPSSINSVAHRLVAITGHRTGPVLGLKPMQAGREFQPAAFRSVPISCASMPTPSVTTSRERPISVTQLARPYHFPITTPLPVQTGLRFESLAMEGQITRRSRMVCFLARSGPEVDRPVLISQPMPRLIRGFSLSSPALAAMIGFMSTMCRFLPPAFLRPVPLARRQKLPRLR